MTPWVISFILFPFVHLFNSTISHNRGACYEMYMSTKVVPEIRKCNNLQRYVSSIEPYHSSGCLQGPILNLHLCPFLFLLFWLYFYLVQDLIHKLRMCQCRSAIWSMFLCFSKIVKKRAKKFRDKGKTWFKIGPCVFSRP